MFSCIVHLVSADMKTSHGEPKVICVYNALDEAELTIKWQLFAISNAWVMLATALVKLDAVKTRRSTGEGVGVGLDVGVDNVVGEIVGVGVCVE